MENIFIKGTEDTPEIVFNIEEGVFSISGRSLPEDVTKFYSPVISWLEDLSKSEFKDFVLSVKLDYFNTSSSKIILDILYLLEECKENGVEVKINWYYEEDDDDMSEAIDEYSELVDILITKLIYE